MSFSTKGNVAKPAMEILAVYRANCDQTVKGRVFGASRGNGLDKA